MLKRSKLLVAAIAIMIAGTGPAGAALTIDSTAILSESVPAYRTYMYSDATKTTVVGTIEPTCAWRPDIGPYVQYGLVGQYTYFQEDEFVYYCGPYGPEPI